MTRDVRPILLKIAAHESVQTLMAGRMLNESSLVAKRVATIFAHAVEMGLVFSVAAVRVFTVLVESVADVAFRDGFVFQDSHRILDAGFFSFLA